MEEAGRDADLRARVERWSRRSASSHRLREQTLEVRRACTAAGWSGGRCRRRRSRPAAGSARARTPTAAEARRRCRSSRLERAAARRRSRARRRSTPTDVRELVELRRHRLDVPGAARCRSSARWPGRGAGRRRSPSACAQECTAPRSFWNAIAPIIELIIMSRARLQVAPARAPRSAARARRCACLRARCRRRAGGRPATGSSRCCGSARPCRWPR